MPSSVAIASATLSVPPEQRVWCHCGARDREELYRDRLPNPHVYQLRGVVAGHAGQFAGNRVVGTPLSTAQLTIGRIRGLWLRYCVLCRGRCMPTLRVRKLSWMLGKRSG
jgi:hypothetical protein